MNRMHNRLCASEGWAAHVRSELVPWSLEGLTLGDDVLEVGPGLGATTRVLVHRAPVLSVLEIDPGYVARLRDELGDRADIVQGDATRLPYADGRFSAVVCFTMLHHIDSPALQDRAFSEVARVLAPGGVFAGTDSLGGSLRFRLIHIGDTLTLIDPAAMPARLRAAGLTDPQVEVEGRRMRFRATRPR